MFEEINAYLGTLVAFLLIFVGGMFFVKLRLFRLIFLRTDTEKKAKNGKISPFRAMSVALAGTLGVGNIVGVASAIYLGGFGAIFWMEVSALFAMALKYAETVLAVSHRRSDGKGGFFGGALYYIKDFFERKGLIRLGKALCFVFVVFLLVDSFSTGCIIQINAASQCARDAFGIPEYVTGAILACLVCALTLTGFDGLSKLTEILIPILTVAYVLLSLAVIIIERAALHEAITKIFADAFDFSSVGGGAFGFLTSRAMRFGTVRGLISNEAGCGTSPTAHAASGTDSPVRQGLFGIFEVFIDTTLLCTLTALVIAVNYSSVSSFGNNGILMAIGAYEKTLGVFAKDFLSLSVVFFGFATLLCRAHYGRESMRFLFPKKSSLAEKLYVVIYSSVAFFGASITQDSVWNFADLSISVLTVINVTILIFMQKEIVLLSRAETKIKKARK